MIAITQPIVPSRSVHDKFLELLPLIERAAELAFRSHRPAEREELVQEVVANSFVAFRRLAELDKLDLAYATPLAMYAIRQVRAGRRVGTPVNRYDVLSPANRGVTVEHLERFDYGDCEWKEVLVEDRHAGPAETAAARLDVANWFRKLPATKRRVARVLATGETTRATAQQFGVSLARISQLRSELQQSWRALQGEPGAV